MRRTLKLLVLPATIAVALLTAACGSDRLSVPKTASTTNGGSVYHGAVIFSQRCAGCHTLSFAGAHGSASNIRTAQGNSGPNFDERCERPLDRILYAIENGGFSGAYMPQNIVVGADAVDVARFVALYSGRDVPAEPGIVKCLNKTIGALPADTQGLSAAGPLDAPKGTDPDGNGGIPKSGTSLSEVTRGHRTSTVAAAHVAHAAKKQSS